MIKKVSKKIKIVLLSVIAAAVLCASVITVLSLVSSKQDNLIYKGHSIHISLDNDRKKEFHIGLSSAVADDKPYQYDNEAAFYLNQLVYQPLLQIKNDGSENYCVASEIIFKNNGTVANVTVNTKAKFSNGENASADIILNSYEWFLKNLTDYDTLLNNVDSIEKISEKELIINFKAPKLENIKVFNIPIILFDEKYDYALGTGCYCIDSIVSYGNVLLLKNDYSTQKAKYEKVILSPMDYKNLDSLNKDFDFDVFLFNKESQGASVMNSDVYNIFEISKDQGSYLIYNIDSAKVRNAVSSLAGSLDFFDATQDNGAYSRGMLYAYMKKPNYHSLVKKGSFDDVGNLSIAYGYEGGANSIYLSLSDSLQALGIECSAVNLDIYETQQKINADIIIYNGAFSEVADSKDDEKFFESYNNMNAKKYYSNLEKYFAEKNKITPLAKETIWYASLAGRDDLELFR